MLHLPTSEPTTSFPLILEGEIFWYYSLFRIIRAWYVELVKLKFSDFQRRLSRHGVQAENDQKQGIDSIMAGKSVAPPQQLVFDL